MFLISTTMTQVWGVGEGDGVDGAAESIKENLAKFCVLVISMNRLQYLTHSLQESILWVKHEINLKGMR